MTRTILITALAAASVAAFAPQTMAQLTIGPGTFGSSGPAANTTDRMGGGGGAKAAGGTARTTTDKSGKSNASDRMGGGGGTKAAGGAAKAKNLNSSGSQPP
jgi:hypothetical protein